MFGYRNAISFIVAWTLLTTVSHAGVPYCNNYCDCVCNTVVGGVYCGQIIPTNNGNCMAVPQGSKTGAAGQTTCTYYCNQAPSTDKSNCQNACKAEDVSEQIRSAPAQREMDATRGMDNHGKDISPG